MILYSIKYTIEHGPNILLRSLTPDFIFGFGPEDPKWNQPLQEKEYGEVAVKNEAREMMSNFRPTKLDDSASTTVSVNESTPTSFPAPFNS